MTSTTSVATAPTASAPRPPLARFLHTNYRARSATAATLEGAGSFDEILVSSGPGLVPGKPVPGGTQDVQILSWDPLAQQWNVAFDAADKVLSPEWQGGFGAGVSDSAPLLAQSDPIENAGATVVHLGTGHVDLAVYGIDAATNHPAGALALVRLLSGTPTIDWYLAVTDGAKPVLSGPALAQRVSVRVPWLTEADPACCPVRDYRVTLGLRSDVVDVLQDDRALLGAWLTPSAPDRSGAVRTAVVVSTQNSTPGSAVLQPGDVLSSVRGQKPPASTNGAPVIDQLALHHPGERVTLLLQRNGVNLALPVVLGGWRALERPTDLVRPVVAQIGVQLSDVVTGRLVTAVAPGSPAEAAGIQAGDVITAIGGIATGTDEAVIAALTGSAGSSVVVHLDRGGQLLQLRCEPIAPANPFLSDVPIALS